MSADALARAPPREDNSAIPEKIAKLKPSKHPGKPSHSVGQERAVPRTKASPSRNGSGRKRQRDDTPSERKPKRAAPRKPPAVRQLPMPAPTELRAETVQQQPDELLEKLAGVALEYYLAVHDDVAANRRALHPRLLDMTLLLQANVLATNLGDHEWLKARTVTAKTYLATHQASQNLTKSRAIFSTSRDQTPRGT